MLRLVHLMTDSAESCRQYSCCCLTVYKNVNNKILSMICKRDQLFKAWKVAPKNMNKRLEYTKYHHKVNKIINVARNEYRRSQLIKYKGDSKKIWAHINTWLGRDKLDVDSIIKKYLGKSQSMYNICSNLAQTFTKEVFDIKHNICNVKFLNRASYITESNQSFRFQNVSACDVEKIVNTVYNLKKPKYKSNKSPRHQTCRIRNVFGAYTFY